MVGAFTVHAFFVMNTGIHENHQLFEIPLLAIAAALRPRLRPFFLLVSGIVALNINYMYGAGLGMGWMVPRMITGVDISVVIAFVNIGALVWFVRLMRREAAELAASIPAADAHDVAQGRNQLSPDGQRPAVDGAPRA
jgi:hypothetical protein